MTMPTFLFLAQEMGASLQQKHWRLTTAESCTGGGLAYYITNIPGSSEWFDGGFVTYSNAAKEQMIGVDSSILQTFGAVSKETALAMAEGALRTRGTDISIAITGIAGPDGGSVEKPVGLVWFAIVSKHSAQHVWDARFTGNRVSIREQAIETALTKLLAF